MIKFVKDEKCSSKAEHVILPSPDFPSSSFAVKANTEHEHEQRGEREK